MPDVAKYEIIGTDLVDRAYEHFLREMQLDEYKPDTYPEITKNNADGLIAVHSTVGLWQGNELWIYVQVIMLDKRRKVMRRIFNQLGSGPNTHPALEENGSCESF